MSFSNFLAQNSFIPDDFTNLIMPKRRTDTGAPLLANTKANINPP